jgi:hypothetical protein
MQLSEEEDSARLLHFGTATSFDISARLLHLIADCIGSLALNEHAWS